MLMIGTRMTVPVTCAGSRAAMSFSMAMIDTYSVPCAPETRARTLPGLAPFTTTTGMLVAASTPAGTSRVPEDFSPSAAEAVPTVNLDCAETEKQQSDARNAGAKTERWRRIIHLPLSSQELVVAGRGGGGGVRPWPRGRRQRGRGRGRTLWAGGGWKH